jgi:hypothetical protein
MNITLRKFALMNCENKTNNVDNRVTDVLTLQDQKVKERINELIKKIKQ